MKRQKLEFKNAEGQTLAASLELPDPGPPSAYALFAHCFTCGKDVAAASRIARALAAQGIAVLRFDFTGLGSSEGDFANTNFSSNIADLVAAAEHMRDHLRAPELLVGHSLGGAAVLAAAHQLPEVKAVATIGAPATAHHVAHLFQDRIQDIKKSGSAVVSLGGREFTIKSQMVDDLESFATRDHIGSLRKPLLIFHSPFDDIVPIEQASLIFQAAKHPKSFVSLDNADHLLSKPRDSQYTATVLAAWAARYLDLGEADKSPGKRLGDGEVLVTEKNRKFLRGLHTQHHRMLADEPQTVGGADLGPDPYELLLMSLGACTSMTLRMYANRKELPVDDIEVWLKHHRVHAKDCEECESEEGYASLIERTVRYKGGLSDAQQQRFLEIADMCPVHKTLEGEIKINTSGGQEP